MKRRFSFAVAAVGVTLALSVWAAPIPGGTLSPLVVPKFQTELVIPPARPFEVFDEIPSLERGRVPANPLGFVDTRYAEINKLPLEAARGGAHTMYPEYAQRLRELMSPAQTPASERQR